MKRGRNWRTTTSCTLKDKLASGRFVITAEITPPVSCDAADLIAKAAPLKGLADAVNVTDGAGARAHLDAVAAAAILLREGIEPILQFNCRDSNRIALQSELMGAAALGIRNLLLLKGDDPRQGDQPDAKPVFDYDTAALTKVAVTMRDKGELPTGRKVGGKADFFIAAADVPIDPPAGWEPKSLKSKIEAGCEFVQTQFCMDAGVVRRYMARLAEHGVTAAVPDRHFAAALGQVGALDAREAVRHHHSGRDDRAARSGERSGRRGARLCLDLMRELATIPGRRRRAHHGARQRGGDRRRDPGRGGDQAGEVKCTVRATQRRPDLALQESPGVLASLARNSGPEQRTKKRPGTRPGLRIAMCRASYDSACFTRSGENGTRRMRTPVASKIALAIAAATGRIDGSPAPVGGWSGLVEQHDVDLLRRLGDVEDRIGQPVDAGDALVVELRSPPRACG